MAITSDSNSSSTQPTPLTFPAPTFAKLSPHAYVSAHLNSPLGPHRPSGRKPSQARPLSCHTGSLTHANGSAVIRSGDTAVVCGVRAEVLRVEDVPDYEPGRDAGRGEGQEEVEEEVKYGKRRKEEEEGAQEMARWDLLVPNIELATGCSPSHLPSGPPSPLAQALTQRVLTLLHTSHLLSVDDLRIWSQPPADVLKDALTAEEEEEEAERTNDEKPAEPQPKAFWTLYIDILFLSLSGPAFDSAWFAMLAALKNTRLPRAWYDPDRDIVLCSPLASEVKSLSLRDTPVALSFGVFYDGEVGKGDRKGRRWLLADLDGFEEGVCREMGTVVVKGGGKVLRIEKSGGGGVGREEVRALVRLAGLRREEWIGIIGRL